MEDDQVLHESTSFGLEDPNDLPTGSDYDSVPNDTSRRRLPYFRLFDNSELDILRKIQTSLTEPALRLLARLQRRRRTAYFQYAELERRYSSELNGRQLNEILDELAVLNLIYVARLGIETTVATEASQTLDERLDILWGLLGFKMDDLGGIFMTVGGPLLDLWKRRMDKHQCKRQLVAEVVQTCSTTKTLSSVSLHSQVVKAMLHVATMLVTIPLKLRRTFQLLEILAGFPAPTDEAVELVGAFSVDQATYVYSGLKSIIASRRVPPTHFIEAKTTQLLFTSSHAPGRCAQELQRLQPTIRSQKVIFPSRGYLESFEAGRYIEKAVQMMIAERMIEPLINITADLQQQLQHVVVLQNVTHGSENDDLKPLVENHDIKRLEHRVFSRFTYEWAIATALWEIVAVYETHVKDYNKAVELLQLLLTSGLLSNVRHKMYNRLTINLYSNLKEPHLALEAAAQALREAKTLPAGVLTEIARRTLRIISACSSRSGHFSKGSSTTKTFRQFPSDERPKKACSSDKSSSSASEPTAFLLSQNDPFQWLPHCCATAMQSLLATRDTGDDSLFYRYVTATPVVEGSSKTAMRYTTTPKKDLERHPSATRPLFLSETDDFQAVEQFALDWYFDHEMPSSEADIRWVGVHDEGALLREIFGLLMATILFDVTVPDAFIIPTQTAPLDLFTDTFYSSRKERIERRLLYLDGLSFDDLFVEVVAQCSRLYPRPIVGVTWNALNRARASHPRIESWWQTWKMSWNMAGVVQLANSLDWSCPIDVGGQSRLCTNTSPVVRFKRLKITPTRMTRLESSSSATESQKTIRTPIHSEVSSFVTSLSWKVQAFEQFIFIAAIAAGLGGHFLARVLRALCQNFSANRSGFPDLILWKAAKPVKLGHLSAPLEILFAEVKTERDRLSEKQRIWLSAISSAGGRAEVFCIRSETTET